MDTSKEIVESLQYKTASPSWEERKEEIYANFLNFKQALIDSNYYDEVKDQMEEMEQKLK